MKKIIILIIAILSSIFAIKFLQYQTIKDSKANADGTITIIIYDFSGSEKYNQEHNFYIGDTLWDIHWRANDTFKISCNDAFYAIDYSCSYQHPDYGYSIRILMGIETTWSKSYFALYINDEYATNGVSQLPFKDHDVIKWKATKL